MRVGEYKGYPIYKSVRYPKKYYAVVDGEKVYFGDVRYQQYYDKMGAYSHLNHCNLERRRQFHARHFQSKDKIGTPGWFSLNVLW